MVFGGASKRLILGLEAMKSLIGKLVELGGKFCHD